MYIYICRERERNQQSTKYSSNNIQHRKTYNCMTWLEDAIRDNYV